MCVCVVCMPASPGLSERPCLWSSSIAAVRVRSGGRPRRWPCVRSLRARYAPSRGARAWTATGSACASSWSSCSRGVRARPARRRSRARSQPRAACMLSARGGTPCKLYYVLYKSECLRGVRARPGRRSSRAHSQPCAAHVLSTTCKLCCALLPRASEAPGSAFVAAPVAFYSVGQRGLLPLLLRYSAARRGWRAGVISQSQVLLSFGVVAELFNGVRDVSHRPEPYQSAPGRSAAHLRCIIALSSPCACETHRADAPFREVRHGREPRLL